MGYTGLPRRRRGELGSGTRSRGLRTLHERGYYGSTTEILRNRCHASSPVTTVIMSSVLSEAKGTVGRV